MIPISVRLEELTFVARDAHGGGGMSSGLHRVTRGGEPWLFKQYRDDVVPSRDDLTATITWRLALAADLRQRLDERCAMPQSLVIGADGSLVGILMKEAPAKFLVTGSGRATTRTLDTMTLPRAVAERQGAAYVEHPIRIAVLGHLAALVVFLHEVGVVVGDLNAKNVLISIAAGDVEVFLVDCDSMIVAGRVAFVSHDPPFMRCPWVPPGVFKRETDWYKFAKLSIRSLAGSQNANAIDRDHFGTLMRRVEVDMLEAMTTEGCSPSDAHIGAVTADWTVRAGSSGQLWLKTDAGTRRWRPGVDGAQPDDPARVPPGETATPGAHRSKSRAAPVSVPWLPASASLGLVLGTVFVLVLLLALVAVVLAAVLG